MNIYVGNLAKEVSEQDLETAFSNFGAVRSVKVIRDMFSGESRGFGFIEMPSLKEGQAAINDLNTTDLKGKKLIVNEARPKTENGGGARRGGQGGGGFRSGGGSSQGGGGRRRF